MKTNNVSDHIFSVWSYVVILIITTVWFTSVAHAFTIHVVDQQGTAISDGFRWQLEEDNTRNVTEGTVGTQAEPPLGLTFHASHHPVATRGEISAASGNIVQPDASKRYFLSVLPYDGYTLGGAAVPAGTASGDSFTVVVSSTPIPTAQISVFLFEDNSPINGAPDLPLENGINGSFEGFKILVEDAGGGYGATAGTLQTDAFGNPLGTRYNPNGSILSIGDGSIPIGSDGVAVIRNLPPAKYGIQIIPPPGSDWAQTSTIEGSPIIDAWVKANEPTFFVEFGPPGHHVFVGFVHTNTNVVGSLAGAPVSGAVSGRITNNHLNRPPEFGANSGNPVPGCIVGVNEDPLVGGRALFVDECDSDSKFSLPSLPAGRYMLSVWDSGLNVVIANSTLTVLANGDCINPKTPNDLVGGACADLGDLPVFRWFGRYDSIVFFDTDEDGFRDPGEPGLNDLALNLRFRNGVIYQGNATDFDGAFTFERVFPFFNWLVPEVDFGLGLKATGATIIVDAGGGTIPPAPGESHGLVEDTNGIDTHDQTLVPQPQFCSPDEVANSIDNCGTDGVGQPHINPNTGDNLSRTETGPVLTMGMQTFLGQTNYIEWGKSTYGPGENGGISGVIYYASTRAEDDPRFAAFEPWEPGIPRVVVNLYADGDTNKPPFGDPGTGGCPTGVSPAGSEDTDWNDNGCIDLDDNVIEDVNKNGSFDLADVDNYPFGNFPGFEDINHTDISDPGHGYGNGNEFDYGDAIQITSSDSWDDSLPTGCQGDVFTASTGVTTDCFDGLRNFNQVRPAVFDGGYAFDSYFPGGLEANLDNQGVIIETNAVDGLPAGIYIVESITPPGHDLVKEEDKNVDFGESFIPNPALLPAFCVGENHTVPQYVSFQTDSSGSNVLPGILLADLVEAPFMGDARPLCDRKKVSLADGQNAATDFAYFTQVPKAAHVVGVILNDLANEFDPNNPTFGEKAAPPFVPVSFRDWTGREIIRVYSDEFGHYNAMLPSSWSANVPSPSGYSPAMLTACMNDAGPINGNNGGFVIDPFFNRQLSQFCYTFQYMPGATTILDTPVVPIAAFARNGQFPVDCEFPDKTPGIFSVSRVGGNGPLVQPGDTLEIISAGLTQVPNPKYDGLGGTQPLKLTRDYGFGGNTGTVTLTLFSGGFPVNLEVGPSPALGSWSDNLINATVPAGLAAGDYQLTVKNSDGTQSEVSVTVTVVADVNSPGFDVQFVQPSVVQGATPIQDAIDLALDGALILVSPGVYDELIWMYKPVKIQGWGPHGVTINARKSPAEKLQVWFDKLNVELLANTISTADDQFCILNGQETQFTTPSINSIFQFTDGAGITVVGDCGQNGQSSWTAGQARIDGLAITAADSAGAIFAAQHANNLVISNNRLVGNFGAYGGGIVIGNHNLTFNAEIVDSVNHNITINHNQIIENGGADGVGGGISMYTDTDNYVITNNYVCGNFTQGQGGGIGHLGLNPDGIIQNNTILLNQSFAQAQEVSGGGVFIGGIRLPSPVIGEAPLLSVGTGSVTIRENLIQGNQSGAGSGGGVRLEFINGEDVVDNPADNTQWYQVDLLNNMIVNNLAGFAGAGISAQDALRVRVYNDTVANNDSTATTISAFQAAASNNLTSPQPAGIVSNVHSGRLADLANAPTSAAVGNFSDLDIQNSIIWHNRSFCWGATAFDQQGFPTVFGLILASDPVCGAASNHEDLAVLPRGSGFILNPLSSDVTDITGLDASNLSVDPKFIQGFPITDAGQTINQPEATIPKTAAAFDEGGNFIDVRFGPLEPTGNYHLDGLSTLLDKGNNSTKVALSFNGVPVDFDFQIRPIDNEVDIGADETPKTIVPPTGLDSDNDGVPDVSDNCIDVENPDQEESDDDIYGDACDGDFNNNGIVDFGDHSIFLGLIGQSGPKGDFNRSTSPGVDFGDFSILLGMIGNAPGPSGLTP